MKTGQILRQIPGQIQWWALLWSSLVFACQSLPVATEPLASLANQGNIDAEYNLALLYADGRGVPRDLGQARQWMQKAADAGDPEAKKWLGNHGG